MSLKPAYPCTVHVYAAHGIDVVKERHWFSSSYVCLLGVGGQALLHTTLIFNYLMCKMPLISKQQLMEAFWLTFVVYMCICSLGMPCTVDTYTVGCT